MNYLKLTISDALAFLDDELGVYAFNPANTQTHTYWFSVPPTWFEKGQVAPVHREKLFEHIYGKAWRLGNGDGSLYQIVAVQEQLLSPEEKAAKPWATARVCYQWITGDKFFDVKPEEF
jgi:hypothetical protein